MPQPACATGDATRVATAAGLVEFTGLLVGALCPLHDAPSMPILAELLQVSVYLRSVRDLLSEPWGLSGERRVLLDAAIGHALDFETWRSLVRRQGLNDKQAAEMMVRLVESVANVACDE